MALTTFQTAINAAITLYEQKYLTDDADRKRAFADIIMDANRLLIELADFKVKYNIDLTTLFR